MPKWILALDTETNDKPTNWNGRDDDTDCWPRLIQLGVVLASDDGKIAYQYETLIDPEDEWTISPEAESVHGISLGICKTYGLRIRDVIDLLAFHISQADIIVAHNIKFDLPVLICEHLRAFGKTDAFLGKHLKCTMTAGTDVCKIDGPYGYKWPKLAELHQHLFGTGFDGAHSALADAQACLRCYFEMQKNGQI